MSDYTKADETLRLDLTIADVVSLLTIAAAADLDHSATAPRLVAMVYRARTVIDTTTKPGEAIARAFTLRVTE